MTKLRAILYTSLLIAIIPLTSQAQAPRTWVSGVGDDTSPCSRTAPCKTFAGAISKTAAGGEISVLDAGGYGAVVITKSITIDGTGMYTSTLAPMTTGITINATQVKDPRDATVRLRGLSINGTGTGTNGINVVFVGQLSIEDCVIDGFKSNGINVEMGKVFIRNSTIRNNTTAGILVKPGAQVALVDVSLVFNGVGISGTARSLGGVYLWGNSSGDPS